MSESNSNSNSCNTGFTAKVLRDNVTRIRSVVGSYLGDPYRLPLDLEVKPEDLDRVKPDQEATAHVQAIDLKTDPLGKIGADFALRQKNQRMRRDEYLCRVKHKRLLYGRLDTLYRHMKKIEKTLAEG